MRNYIYQLTCTLTLVAIMAGVTMAQTPAQQDKTATPPVVSSDTPQQNPDQLPQVPSNPDRKPQAPVNPDEDKPSSSQTTTMPSNTQPRGNAASQAQSQIQDALQRQMPSGAGNVTVSVAENNSIELTGAVASDDQKKQAEQIAHAAAPDMTIVNNLSVSGAASPAAGSSASTGSSNTAAGSLPATTPSASGEANESGQSAKLPQSVMVTTGSAAVRNKIQAGFKTEPSLRDSSVNVDTTDESVNLSGDVSSQAAKNKALEIARANAGGRKVIDHLRVTTKPYWR